MSAFKVPCLLKNCGKIISILKAQSLKLFIHSISIFFIEHLLYVGIGHSFEDPVVRKTRTHGVHTLVEETGFNWLNCATLDKIHDVFELQPSIHPFVQEIFAENLLYVRHWALCWGYSSKHNPSTHGAWNVARNGVNRKGDYKCGWHGKNGRYNQRLLLLLYKETNYDALTGPIQLCRNIYVSTQYTPGTMMGAGQTLENKTDAVPVQESHNL